MMNDESTENGQQSKLATNMIQNQISNAQFPDILQFLPAEEIRKQIETYSQNDEMINKKGQLGGYTALHWACIRNEFNLIKYLIIECKANIDVKANLGETPLFICVK
jgi:ankyrin repeat protein